MRLSESRLRVLQNDRMRTAPKFDCHYLSPSCDVGGLWVRSGQVWSAPLSLPVGRKVRRIHKSERQSILFQKVCTSSGRDWLAALCTDLSYSFAGGGYQGKNSLHSPYVFRSTYKPMASRSASRTSTSGLSSSDAPLSYRTTRGPRRQLAGAAETMLGKPAAGGGAAPNAAMKRTRTVKLGLKTDATRSTQGTRRQNNFVAANAAKNHVAGMSRPSTSAQAVAGKPQPQERSFQRS